MSFLTSAVSKTTKKLGRAVSKTVVAGEKLVIGRPPSRNNSSSSARSSGSKRSKGSRSKSPKSGRGGRSPQKGRGADDEAISDEVHMFCSRMYTHDFVLDAVKKVESDTLVSRLVLEDLIQRNEPETTEVIVDLLADNFYNCLANKKASGRIWTSIVFIDCISDPDSYKNYLILKQDFMIKLNQQLKMKGMTKELPIKVEAKIELHALLDVYSVIQLLQAVERDSSIKRVKFPGFRGDDKDIVEAFSQLVDAERIEWKKTVVVKLNYMQSGPKGDGSSNSATALVGECARVLETTLFAASMLGGSSGFCFDAEEVTAEKPAALGALRKSPSLNTSLRVTPMCSLKDGRQRGVEKGSSLR